MLKIKWLVAEQPVGKYRSFQKRGWPIGRYADTGAAAIQLSCEDAYHPAVLAAGEHAPITVYIAQHHADPEVRKLRGAFTWRKLKTTYPTLDAAKAAGERALLQHPEFAPPNDYK